MPGKIHQEILDRLGPEDRNSLNWMYEATKSPEVSVMLWGMAQAIAADHQDWTFWQVLREMQNHATLVRTKDGGRVC